MTLQLPVAETLMQVPTADRRRSPRCASCPDCAYAVLVEVGSARRRGCPDITIWSAGCPHRRARGVTP